MREIIAAEESMKVAAKEQMVELLTVMKCNPAQLTLF
jgi:hypothetical protein